MVAQQGGKYPSIPWVWVIMPIGVRKAPSFGGILLLRSLDFIWERGGYDLVAWGSGTFSGEEEPVETKIVLYQHRGQSNPRLSRPLRSLTINRAVPQMK